MGPKPAFPFGYCNKAFPLEWGKKIVNVDFLVKSTIGKSFVFCATDFHVCPPATPFGGFGRSWPRSYRAKCTRPGKPCGMLSSKPHWPFLLQPSRPFMPPFPSACRLWCGRMAAIPGTERTPNMPAYFPLCACCESSGCLRWSKTRW